MNNNKSFQVDIGSTSSLGITIAYSYITDVNNTLQMLIPIPNGYYYRISGSGSDTGTKFVPIKGV